MRKLIFGSIVALATLLVTGCQTPQPVVRNLPPPPLPTVRSEKPFSPSPLTAERPRIGSLRGTKIVIDAGHGGKDPGTRGVSALPEKTIVLSIANEVARVLSDHGASVISTRTGDRFLELDDRAAIAERNRADLFVAVHADASRRPDVSGATVYIGRSASRESYSAARCIVSALTHAGIECRGINHANYRVLVAHSRPAVLVECGFLTNRMDAVRLNSQGSRSQIASAIADGIADYVSK